MIQRIRRALARLHWTRQERHWRAEVARLQLVKETLADDMDVALRNVSACVIAGRRIEVMVRLMAHAPGRGPTNGVQRFSLLEPRA
jgi:hypothetical protein